MAVLAAASTRAKKALHAAPRVRVVGPVTKTCVSCPLYNASTSYYHDTPSSLGGEEETGGGDTVATNPGQAEQVVDAEPQTDRIHRKQRLGAHTCNICTAPDTWHLAVFKAFRSELLTSPY